MKRPIESARTVSRRRPPPRPAAVGGFMIGLLSVSAWSADGVGRLDAADGVCRTREPGDIFWKRISPGDSIRAGQRIACNYTGTIRLTLPESGAQIDARIVAEVEYPVPAGRNSPTPQDRTRPGLRANADESPAGAPTPQSDERLRSFANAEPTQWTPVERQMRADSDRFNQTVIGGILTGTVAGATTGALAAWLTGRDGKAVRNAAVAGAVVGGAIGGISGYVTAKKEQAGRSESRALQAAAADVRQDNQKLQAFIDSSSNVLAEGKLRLTALQGDVAAGHISVEQAAAARQREEQNIASMNITLAQAKKTRDQYIQAAAQLDGTALDRRDLDAEIARMNKHVAHLEGNIAEYKRALTLSEAR